MTDPNTPTQSSNNPQDLIDQALGSSSSTPAPAAETPKQEVPANSEQSLPTPEPLSQTSNQTVVAPSVAEASTPLPTATDTVPTELTNPQTEPVVLPEPPKETKPMGEDMPLAFMGGADLNTPTTQQPVSNITVEPISPAILPPTLTGNSAPDVGTVPTKKKSNKIVTLLMTFLVAIGLFSGIGYWYYTDYRTVPMVAPVDVAGPEECSGCDGGHELVWRNGQCVWKARLCGGGEEGNPTDTGNQKECTGCREGYEVEWNGTACIKRSPCKVEDNTTESSCAADGGTWCSSVDLKGRQYGFCGKTSSTKNCNDLAAEQGYLILEGIVKCQCAQTKTDGTCAAYEAAADGTYANSTLEVINEVDRQCRAQAMGTGAFLCKQGVKGYSGGQCTAANGVAFTGNLGCFCGTVQVDTGTGHTSYTSSCGCDKPEDTPNPSPFPSTTTNPTLMCNGLTRTPTTTPAVGDKVTFTCAGASTPAGAVSLTYKFRYSLNNGGYVSMNNKTATTTELTIASCGSYKVQCQACGTINGVLTCDPNWTAATQ